MNVCLLVNQLAPGGAPTLLLNIVTHTSSEANVEYTVCFIEGDETLVPEFEEAGVRVVNFGADFKFDPRAIARMIRFFRTEEFDVLHAHLPYSQTLGRLFGRVCDVEHVVSTQHSAPNNYHPLTRFLERLTRPLDSRTIAVSKAVERLFTGEARAYEPGQTRQWCTIYNGIDTEAFGTEVRTSETDFLRNEWEIGDGPVFLNVGRYFAGKSQRTLVEAMVHVLDEFPSAQLLIVGWGALENDLRAAVRKRDLDGSVHITGRGSPIHPYYRLADEFVLSSIRESFGIVLLEAMAAKLPVVATDVQGIPEVVDHGRTGLLVPPNDPKKLAEAMVEALRTDEPLGENGYERAATRFDIRTTTASHISLYRELYSDTPRPSATQHD